MKLQILAALLIALCGCASRKQAVLTRKAVNLELPRKGAWRAKMLKAARPEERATLENSQQPTE